MKHVPTNLLKTTLFPIIFLLLIEMFPATAIAQFAQDQNFLLGVSEVMKARGEYQYHIANARLHEARAALVLAQTRHQQALTNQLVLFTKRLQFELRHLVKEEVRNRAKIKSLQSHIKRIQIIKTGKTSQRILSSLNQIIRYVPSRVLIDSLRKPIAFSENEKITISKDMFIANRKSNTTILDFRGKYVGDLLRFITTNNYSLQAFSEAHFLILDALDSFDSYATQKLQEIRDYLLELRDGTLNIWSPPGLERMQLPGSSNGGGISGGIQ